MLSTDGVVHAIAKAFDGRIPGRTLLQKVAYFIGDELQLDLGFDAHYYGPYSREMAAALDRQEDVGALIANRRESGRSFSGHDGSRVFYDYALTNRGRRFQELQAEWGGEDYARAVELAKKIESLGVDYMQLAFASKVHFILVRTEETAMTVRAVQDKAKELGWSLGEHDIQKGVDLLKKLGHIKP
jgi:uncharacterized protein YwgA